MELARARALADRFMESVTGDNDESVAVREKLIEEYQKFIHHAVVDKYAVEMTKTNEDYGRWGVEGEPEECEVCKSEISIGANMRILPCGRRFHAECTKRWFNQTLNCAKCRTPLMQDLANDFSNVDNEVLRDAIVLRFSVKAQ